MSKFPRPIKGFAEQDAYTGWRHLLCYIDRPGVRKSIKRDTHKRERQEGKRFIDKEMKQ